MASLLKRVAGAVPGVRALDRALRRRYTGTDRRDEIGLPRGHYGSPLPGYDEVAARAGELFRKDIAAGPGLDLRVPQQLDLVRAFAPFYADFDWPDQPAPGRRYHVKCGWYEAGDALALYGMMRHFRPGRVVEVGSGFSSALMLDVNERFLGGRTRFTFVEPHPERRLNGLLTPADRGAATVVASPVQGVPAETFAALEANDILFVDSSYVSKIGSDVNRLFFDVLPRLRPGVLVHVHDIFWPFEYPREWIDRGLAWNEAYLLRAFLLFNRGFEILFFNDYLAHAHAGDLRTYMPRFLDNPGGAIWLRRTEEEA